MSSFEGLDHPYTNGTIADDHPLEDPHTPPARPLSLRRTYTARQKITDIHTSGPTPHRVGAKIKKMIECAHTHVRSPP